MFDAPTDNLELADRRIREALEALGQAFLDTSHGGVEELINVSLIELEKAHESVKTALALAKETS